MRPGAAVFSAALLATAASGFAAPCFAGAWPKGEGRGQVIVKYERMRADEGFDPDGVRRALPAPRRDSALGVFAEYGLTDRLTLQAKGELQSGVDAFVNYEGRGPLEIGLNWTVWRGDASAVSLYAGAADGGEGRNAGYALPGIGDRDWELRVSAGRALFAGRAFIEVQGARRLREGLPDETRIDLTAGLRRGDWLFLTQAFGGAADGGARWLAIETSAVRDMGDWSIQAGWRTTVWGRETPVASGPVIGLWRRF